MSPRFLIALLLLAFISLNGCKAYDDNQPHISFENYKIADGFEIQLAASEPLIEAPVAMDFDNKGRMWIVEMRGYMPDLAGAGEDNPNGRISILEDLDNDGVADHSKIFLDSLVLPRAIAHVYGGLLYAVPPNLWFVEIKNDKPGNKTLVDSTYADVGNIESQPNGLMMNIDNWIYSANSNFRYQLKQGKWIKEPTSFRGQFGITKDNVGRIYYNSNEIQIAGDYVLPNTIINNPYLKPKEAINRMLTDDQRVYPLHPTTVNRGSEKGILNKDSLLVKFTAACGPLIYRGGQFPDSYNQNAFACEPQANLVKRNVLTFDAVKTTAKQAWNDKEFIASTDEGFRPVNLFNGPDGALYVVDMHRGIMQHRAYATPYYRNEIGAKKLDTLLSAGRILRVKYKNKKLETIPDLLNSSASDLIELLKNKNGWVRDRAQQLLIFKQEKSVVPQLQKLVSESKKEITAIHALHTLDGLNALSFDFLKNIAAVGESMLAAHAIVLLKQFNDEKNVIPMAELTTKLLAKKDSIIDLYIASSLDPWIEKSRVTFLPVLSTIARLYQNAAIYNEAIVSSLKGSEEAFQQYNFKNDYDKNSNGQLDSLLVTTIKNKRDKKMNPIYVQQTVPIDARTNGLIIFRNTCATCHGVDGDGLEHIAPPLKGSQYVEGSPERLAMIILHGLEGPIHVNGQLYQFNGSMPNFGNNFSDKEIADIIKYLHNSFVSQPVKSINAEKIKELRNKMPGTLTEKKLLKMADPIK
ncbi:MAG TPA: c-type cytochrome [Chitinophagaceae bacterium]